MKKDRPFEPEESLLADLQWLRHLAARLIQDPALADDACQEAWLLAGHAAGVEDRRPALFRAMRRFAWRWHRAENRRKGREAESARPEGLPSTTELLARGEERQVLWRRLTELEEPYRTALLLKFQEGLDTKAIAARKGAPNDTVRRWVRRGLELLRERYETDRGGSGFEALSLAALPLGISSTSAALSSAVPSASSWPTASGAGTSLSATASSFGAILGAWIMKKALIAVVVLLAATLVGTALLRESAAPAPAMASGQAVVAKTLVQPATELNSNLALEESAATREEVSAAPELARDLPPVTAPENSRVTGRVVDSAGDPLAGVLVQLLGGDTHWALDPEWTSEFFTATDGSFAVESQGFQGPKPVRLRITGSPYQLQEERLFGSGRDCHFGLLNVPAVDVGKITLSSAGVVIGRLLSKEGHPVAGAWIDPSPGRGYARSDSGGRFRLEHLYTGSIRFGLKCAGFIRQDPTATVTAGETLDLGDVVFETAPRVSGIVTDLDGNPVPNTSVSTGGYTRGWVFDTEPDGTFDVPLQKNEVGTIIARGKGHKQTDGLRVSPGDTQVRIELTPYEPYFVFYVRDVVTEEPLREYGIQLRLGSNPSQERLAEGGWKWRAPESSRRHRGRAGVLCKEGHEVIDVAAPGYERRMVLVTRDASSGEGQVIHLTPSSGIRGRLIDNDGPVASEEVVLLFGDVGRVRDLANDDEMVPVEEGSMVSQLLDDQGMYTVHSLVALDRPLPSLIHHSIGGLREQHAYTDAEGRFRFVSPEQGVGRLDARRVDGTTLAGELFSVGPNGDLDLGDLKFVTGATVKGRLLPEWAGDLSGCKITLESDSSRSVSTEADGYFQFTGVPPGEHRLLIGAGPTLCSPDLWMRHYFFRVGEGETRELEVPIPAYPGCQLEAQLLVNGEPAREGMIELVDVTGDDRIGDLDFDDASAETGSVSGLFRAGISLLARVYHKDAVIELPGTFVLPVGSTKRTFELATGALEIDVPVGLDLPRDSAVTLNWQTREGVTGSPLSLWLHDDGRLIGSRGTEDLRFVFPCVPLEARTFTLEIGDPEPYSEQEGERIGVFEAELKEGEVVRVSM